MKNIANWIAANPLIAAGALTGFIALVWVVGFENAVALLSQLAGE